MRQIYGIVIIISCILFLANSSLSAAIQVEEEKTVKTEHFKRSGLELSGYKILPIKANKTYTLTSDWDLKGDTFLIPEGVTLKCKSGVFKNGTLFGNNTKIETDGVLFCKVSIKGFWNVPIISTSLFSDLNYENSLRDVLALAHPDINNEITIAKGDYYVSARLFQPALSVCSNIDLVIDGNIRLVPNSFKRSYVFNVKDAKNVTISGKGCIYGDKHNHKGVVGEWGHGINVVSSENVTIRDFSVRDCWGDCIYVGKNSKNIIIKNCKLDHGRRQGISVTSADGVLIENCFISNVSGTNPQAAIDIEPNHNEIVDNVIIMNTHCENCYGGIETWRPKDAKLGTVFIKGCTVMNTQKKWSIIVKYAKTGLVENCTVFADDHTAILASDVDDIKILNNRVHSTLGSPIKVLRCNRREVKKNVIIKRKEIR